MEPFASWGVRMTLGSCKGFPCWSRMVFWGVWSWLMPGRKLGFWRDPILWF